MTGDDVSVGFRIAWSLLIQMALTQVQPQVALFFVISPTMRRHCDVIPKDPGHYAMNALPDLDLIPIFVAA
jgi:hypothetical protein